MFDGVMILVLVLEHNLQLSTLEELEDQTMTTKEVVPIHNAYHLTLTISSTYLVNNLIH